MSVENIDRIRKQSASIELNEINKGILELSRTMQEASRSTQPRILLELSIVKLSSDLSAAAASLAQPLVQRSGQQTGMSAGTQLASLQEKAVNREQHGNMQAAQPENQRAEDSDMMDAGRRTVPDTAEAAGGGAGTEAFDLDAIWNAVFEDGEAAKGSFYMIGSSGRLVEIGESHFVIEIASDSIRSLAEMNRSLLEELMEKHTGKRRALKLISDAGSMPQHSENIEEIAHQAEALLGIPVEIK